MIVFMISFSFLFVYCVFGIVRALGGTMLLINSGFSTRPVSGVLHKLLSDV